MTIFMIQKAKIKAFDGWYNEKAFTTLEAAERYLAGLKENDWADLFVFCINHYEVRD